MFLRDKICNSKSSNFHHIITSIILLVAAVDNHNYSYTIGIDREDIYLWYESTDSSVQLTDIKWKRHGITGIFINPLLVYNLIYLQSTSYVTIECIDTTSGYSFVTVGLFFQGLLLLSNCIFLSYYSMSHNYWRLAVNCDQT